MAAASPLLALLLAGALIALLAEQAVGQTFSYSRGWKSGKRAGLPGAAAPAGPSPPGGRTNDDGLAEDMPLFRYFLEGRGEHRAPFDPWRLAEEPVLHLGRRPSLALGALGDQNAEHEER